MDTSNVAKVIGQLALPAITSVPARVLTSALEPFEDEGMYTFLRLNGSVEHRSSTGELLAISVGGKHYIERGGVCDGNHLRAV